MTADEVPLVGPAAPPGVLVQLAYPALQDPVPCRDHPGELGLLDSQCAHRFPGLLVFRYQQSTPLVVLTLPPGPDEGLVCMLLDHVPFGQLALGRVNRHIVQLLARLDRTLLGLRYLLVKRGQPFIRGSEVGPRMTALPFGGIKEVMFTDGQIRRVALTRTGWAVVLG
jgi:hypothetical protein